MDIVTVIIALVLAFIAFKVLMGLVRVGAIILIIGVVVYLLSQGVIG